MSTKHTDILIIGAGLTGLTLAYYLKNLNVSVIVVEANSRIGGRIHTKYNKQQAPIELGATWLVPQQTNVLQLLKTLNIPVFEQHYGNTAIYEPSPNKAPQLVQLPPNNASSYRIANGTQQLITILAETLDESTIQTNQTIHSIITDTSKLVAKTEDNEYHAKHIISTLPPQLLLNTIATEPALPDDLKEVALKTHTWMKDSIRVGFTYKTAFWKGDKTSGTIYSSNGPLQEFYDHSNVENTLHALSGFMNGTFALKTKDERKQLALKQLHSYYGDQALDFESYEECVWANEKLTVLPSDAFLMPQQNNGNSIYQNSYLNNRLFIAGAETSPIFSGKMEGAITSAQFVFNSLKSFYSKA